MQKHLNYVQTIVHLEASDIKCNEWRGSHLSMSLFLVSQTISTMMISQWGSEKLNQEELMVNLAHTLDKFATLASKLYIEMQCSDKCTSDFTQYWFLKVYSNALLKFCTYNQENKKSKKRWEALQYETWFANYALPSKS